MYFVSSCEMNIMILAHKCQVDLLPLLKNPYKIEILILASAEGL